MLNTQVDIAFSGKTGNVPDMTQTFAGGPTWTWGDRIRKVRRDIAGIGQEAMAAMIGVNPATLSSWEGNRARPYLHQADSVARKIEDSFPGKVTAAWLLGQGADDLQPLARPARTAEEDREMSYVDLAERPWLPRMDSNHQPPDVRIVAGRRLADHLLAQLSGNLSQEISGNSKQPSLKAQTFSESSGPKQVDPKSQSTLGRRSA